MTSERIEKQRKSLKKYYEKNDSKKMIVMDIISPSNEVVKIRGLNEFCKKYKISYRGLRRIIDKYLQYYKGWHLPETSPYIPKMEQIRGPDGIIYTFTSITKFCKERNMDKGNLRKVLNGVCNSCKGFCRV